MYIGCARSTYEIELAIALAAETFRPNEESIASLETKYFLMSAGKNLSSKDVVVITNDDQKVIGTCFLIDRVFGRMGEQLKGTFLSSICIASSMKGKGLSKLLMNSAIAACEDRTSDFAILIARRAVDHFYNKFGFWGISTYSKISFVVNDAIGSKNEILIESAADKHMQFIQEMHAIVYSTINGYCERSLIYWQHILRKVKWLGASFFVFKTKGRAIGYAIHTGTEIHEIAAIDDYGYLELLITLGKKIAARSFTIYASQYHPVVGELKHTDFSITARQCYYGGHMVRIISKHKLIEICRQSLRNYPREDNKFHIDVNGKGFAAQNNYNGLDLEFQESPIGYENTCTLMGASYLSVDPKMQYLFKLSPFNVLLFDQV